MILKENRFFRKMFIVTDLVSLKETLSFYLIFVSLVKHGRRIGIMSQSSLSVASSSAVVSQFWFPIDIFRRDTPVLLKKYRWVTHH